MSISPLGTNNFTGFQVLYVHQHKACSSHKQQRKERVNEQQHIPQHLTTEHHHSRWPLERTPSLFQKNITRYMLEVPNTAIEPINRLPSSLQNPLAHFLTTNERSYCYICTLTTSLLSFLSLVSKSQSSFALTLFLLC